MQPAQTNIQLYHQLLAAGWAEDDLRNVQSAYRLALRVVAGQYHASERPFLAHLVGVASILACDGAHATIVSAGLLHSVYQQGDFGDGSRGISKSRRLAVRRAVGAASEELIARYADLITRYGWFTELLERRQPLKSIDSAVAWIKLADLLECAGETQDGPQAAYADKLGERCAILATELGHPRLAAALAAAYAEPIVSPGPHFPTFLRGQHRHSFAVAPMSHAVRPGVRLLRLFQRVRQSLLPNAPVGPRLAPLAVDN